MKNNLLTEIERIKDIMFLNESSNQECEAQLEKDGYTVYNRTELLSQDDECTTKDNINCVKEWFDGNGVVTASYRIGKVNGLCYLVYKTTEKRTNKYNTEEVTLPYKTYIFWGNSEVTVTYTLSQVHHKDMEMDGEKPNENYIEKDDIINQLMYKGNFGCDGDNIELDNMVYMGMYDLNKTNIKKKPYNFKTYLGDNTFFRNSNGYMGKKVELTKDFI